MKPSIRGFTQVELIVAMVVAGILAAVILPRWDGSTGFEERGFRDGVLSSLRYAQKSAIAARRSVCATLTEAEVTFAIAQNFGDANCAAAVPLVGPDGQDMVVRALSPASFSAPFPAGIVFDPAGRPSNGGVTLSFTGLPAALNITLEAETGYAH